jgi:hypothetical protein
MPDAAVSREDSHERRPAQRTRLPPGERAALYRRAIVMRGVVPLYYTRNCNIYRRR